LTTEVAAKKYLTTAEVSARLSGQVKPQTLANWRNLGEGPPFTKVGGKVLYPEDRLEAWLQQRTVNSTSDYTKAKS
jgi:hypothetical protein